MTDYESADVQVKVEDEPVYSAQAEPVDAEYADGSQADQQTGLVGAQEAVAPLKEIQNPMDKMDGWTLLVTLLITTIIVFVAACVTLFPAAYTGLNWWAFVGSLLCLIMVIVLMILKKCCEEASIKAAPIMTVILLVLWLGIVMPATFAGPFNLTLNNGWIGCWASLAVCAALASRAFADRTAALKKAIATQTGSESTKFALFLGIASIVVLIASSVAFGSCAFTRNGLRGYAVSVPVISIVCTVLVLIFANVESMKAHSGKVNIAMSIFLIVWWAIGAFITTFLSPYGSIACSLNGYIATWVCVFAAFSLFKAAGLDTIKGLVDKMKKGKGKGGEEADTNTPAASDETPAL